MASVSRQDIAEFRRAMFAADGKSVRAGRRELKQVRAKTIKPMRWDGTWRGAERLMDVFPSSTISITGGAKGCPIELGLANKKGETIDTAQVPVWVGLRKNGSAYIVRLDRRVARKR